MKWRAAYKSKQVAVLLAIVATVVLNLLIFMLLPYLIKTDGGFGGKTAFPAVAITRVVPPAPPQQQLASKKTPRTAVKKQHLARQKPQIAKPKLALNLQLRPEIPNSMGQVVMPDVQLAKLEPIPTVFDSAALDKPLMPLAQSPFIYPMRAKRLGIEGWVRIKLLIDKTGNVEQVHIVEAQPQGTFEQTVERGVRLWRFTPGTVEGQPVRSWVITTVRFELE